MVHLAVLLAASACADRETYTERLEGVPLLLGEFTSYATEAHVRARLGARPVTTLERNGTPANDRRPPFELVRLAVAHAHLGQTGELELVFFNDRLMAARFYPADSERYTTALQRADVDLTAGAPLSPQPNLQVLRERDHAGRDCVVWTDTRLSEQNERWIARYA